MSASWRHILALACLGTAVSILVPGFWFGITNNVYHIPVVLKLFDAAKFAHDPFYQSLRNYTSLVWPALSLVATPGNVYFVFLCAHIVSRVSLYVASILFLWRLGLKTISGLTIATVLLALGETFAGYSMIGATGMQTEYFTHSEMVYPFILASLMLAASGRTMLAFAVNGLTLNINAFSGVWTAAVLPIVVLAQARPLRGRISRILAGTAVQGIVALPTLLWIFNTVAASRGAPDFDYIVYLRSFYPKHFIIDASSGSSILQFAMACTSGCIALWTLRAADRPWKTAFLGFVGLFAVGVALPYVTSARLLLNLHLLRIDGVVILLSLLLVAKAVIPVAQASSAIACAVLTMLALGDWRLTAIALGLLVQREGSTKLFSACLAGLVILTAITQIGVLPDFVREQLLVALICLALAYLANDLVLASFAVLVASISFPILFVAAGTCLLLAVVWKERASFFIAGTAVLGAAIEFAWEGAGPKAMLSAGFMVLALTSFLVVHPMRKDWVFGPRMGMLLCILAFLICGVQRALDARYGDPATRLKFQQWYDAGDWARLHTPDDAEFLVPARMNGFQLRSQRRVWVDWQQGAAVMWSPSLYSRWNSRYSDMLKLKSHAEFYNYARSHDLPYYVIARNDQPPNDRALSGETRVYDNRLFEIYRLDGEAALK